MTREKAEKEARKRWGAKAYISAGNAISSQERRSAAKEKRDSLRARRDAIDAEVKARLEALDWYQALQAERREVVTALKLVDGHPAYYKFSVGECIGVGFHVRGQGDTWEEAFAKADERRQPHAS